MSAAASQEIDDIFKTYENDYHSQKIEEMSIVDYLELCKEDPMAYASASERLYKALGEPELVDTSTDPRLSRIFQNQTIIRYSALDEFYGMEEAIMNIASHLKHAAQGLEESRQMLYLLGPVGSAKSSLAEKFKELMEKYPIYVLKDSPLFESPLGLFDRKTYGPMFQEKYGIDPRYLKPIPSPWALKRLQEAKGDLRQLKVEKVHPSILKQLAITKVEPGDENNQDISALVGKVDIRKLEDFSQDDPDAYSYSGGLNRATQGVMEFVEMFKAPIKVLHPLLTALQEGHYNGTEAIGAMPFHGLGLAHSNESEWQSFSTNKKNEAFLDRVNIVKVPYCLRISEEVEIYKKLLRNSELADAPCAPETLEMLAKFAVLSRLKEHENSDLVSKMLVYDGQNVRETHPKAKSMAEYKEVAGNDEGMEGISTRFAYKTLSKVFNFHADEVSANPVNMLYVLEQQIKKMDLGEDKENRYLGFIKEYLTPEYMEFVQKEIQSAYVESYDEYGQNIFDRYLNYADMWIQGQGYKDPESGQVLDKDALEKELEKIEKPAAISNPKDFRNEIVNFVLRARAKNDGNNPDWKSYEKMKEVIEKRIYSKMEEIIPVISFTTKRNEEEQKKHEGFVDRMQKRGYTAKDVRRITDWYIRSLNNV